MRFGYRHRVKWMELLGVKSHKERITGWWRVGLSSLLVLCLGIYHLTYGINLQQDEYNTDTRWNYRKLLANESHELPVWEQCTFETDTSSGAWVFSHAVCVIIIFIALAIICDDFFVPSLEIISEKLNLSEDVAGATFMAAGSSAPELFSSVAGVAVESDVGVGTIVGSAVFNLLIIIALTAALAGQVLHLDWRPLLRDTFFYAMSIGCFIGFSWDGYFMHYEAVILLVLYALYIILMVFNPRLMDWLGTIQCCGSKIGPSDEEDVKDEEEGGKVKDTEDHRSNVANGNAGKIEGETKNGKANGDVKKTNTEDNKNDEDAKSNGSSNSDDEEETMNICPCLPCCPLIRTHTPNASEAKAEGGCWNWFKVVLRWVLFIPAFPFVVLFSWTVPDCSKSHNKKYFLLSFFMSVFWIAVLSFGMVTLVVRVGCILNIDTYIMGLVIVAVGTSIPDALSSILVARDGYGDMAVSNAIGSNVFDINLGLGLPFLIRVAIDAGKPISLLDDDEWADLMLGNLKIIPHAKFGFILLLLLIIALSIFLIARFRLNKWIGISFVFMYALFLAYAFIQELYCARQLDTYC